MEKLLSQGKIENTAIISIHDPVDRGRRYPKIMNLLILQANVNV